MNHLGVDSDENIINYYGNFYKYNQEEYEIMDEKEVIEYGKDLISDDLEEILFQSVPKHLHQYFDRKKYIEDKTDEVFKYVNFGNGFHEVEDDNQNIYFIFPL